MIDPTTIAAAGAAAATLFATKAVEGAGSKAGEALTAVVGKLVDLVRGKAKDDKALEGALIVVDDDSSDETAIQMLGKLLAKRSAADPAFARELLAFVAEANEAGARGDRRQSRPWRRVVAARSSAKAPFPTRAPP